MLTKMRAYIAQHAQAALMSLNVLGNKPLATFMTILVIAITLTLPALFWVFTDNMEQLTRHWQQGSRISLYLKTSLSVAEENAFLNEVRTTSGVGDALLKTAEEGLQELEAQEGMQDIMSYLPENPLPAVIEVTPALNNNSPEQLERLYHQLKDSSQVEQAKIDLQWVNRLHALIGFAVKAAHGLMLLLALAVVLIIGNTLRLIIHHRQDEIQVLKLIGATDPYIVRPFLYSGIWYGIAGAILAVILVNIFMSSLALAARQLTLAYQMSYPLFLNLSMRQGLLLIASATILGWLGARLSVRRQLASIEPYH